METAEKKATKARKPYKKKEKDPGSNKYNIINKQSVTSHQTSTVNVASIFLSVGIAGALLIYFLFINEPQSASPQSNPNPIGAETPQDNPPANVDPVQSEIDRIGNRPGATRVK